MSRWDVLEAAAVAAPGQIEFVSELPKTVSGRIRRVELRERARS